MLKKLIGISLLGAAVLLTSCGDNGSTASGTTPTSTAATSDAASKIEVVGSTSVSPLIEKMAAEYNKTDANTKINIQAVGSSAGIKAAQDGTAQIGMSSRELKDSEKAQLTETKIAIDPIAVVTNPANGVENLTKDQIIGIFKGEIKNWKEVGGNDAEINLVIREASSGTRGAFEELLGLEGENGTLVDEKNAAVMDATSGVIQTVKGNANAIGYVSYSAVSDEIKALKVGGVEINDDNIADKSYALQRPFVHAYLKNTDNELVQAYLQFLQTDEAQNIMKKDKLIPQEFWK